MGFLLLLAATVWSFKHMLLGLSNHNKVVLWTECEGGAKCNLHKKNVQLVRFIAKTRECGSNLSVGVALTVWFTYGEYMKMTRDEHVQYLDLNLATFQHMDGFGCYHFCLNRFGLELMMFFCASSQLSVQFWDCRLPRAYARVGWG